MKALVVGRTEPQRPEEGADIVDQQLGLLERCKVPTLGHRRMAAQVEATLDPLFGRRQGEIGREGGEAGRGLDPLAFRQAAIVLYAERLALSQDIAEEVYAAAVDHVEGLAADAALDPAGLATVLRLRADFFGKTPAPPETYVDLSYYRRALAEPAA